jgi:hypothetical protein
MACESDVTQKLHQVRYYLLNVSTRLVAVDASQIAAMHWDLPKPGLPLFRQSSPAAIR